MRLSLVHQSLILGLGVGNVAAFAPSSNVNNVHSSSRLMTSSSLGMKMKASESSSSSLDRRALLRNAILGGSAAFVTSFASPQIQIANAAATPTTPTSSFPTWTLDNNVQFPTLALNTVGLSVDDTVRAMELATKEGFTHIDFHPGKERDGVAKYLEKYPSAEARNNLFLNTKIRKPKPGTSASDAADQCRDQIVEDLKILGVDSVDMLMLRDSPDCDVMQAQWAVMEQALADGKTKSIGVINYCEGSLKCLLETAKVKPALNYYMVHVGMGQNPTAISLRKFCDDNGIKTFGYGAVGEPGPNDEILNSPTLKKIGKKHGNKAPEEVALRWVIQGGAAVSVRPTTEFGLGLGVCSEENGASKCATGLKKRAGVFDWSLTDKEMAELTAMSGPDDNPTLFSSAGCPGSFVMPK